MCLGLYVPGGGAGECFATTGVTTEADSLCGHIDDFTPPSFTSTSNPRITITNTNPFDASYYQIRNDSDQPTLRLTLAAGEQSIIDNTAGLWFFTDHSGLVFPFENVDPPCYVVF